jgi:hypothetical protein
LVTFHVQLSVELPDHCRLPDLGGAVHGSVIHENPLRDEFANALFSLVMSVRILHIDPCDDVNAILVLDGLEKLVHVRDQPRALVIKCYF